MKICLINNLFTPYEHGGAEKVVKYIYDDLIMRGHEVFVISTKPHFDKNKDTMPGVYYLSSFFYNIAKLPWLFRFFCHLWTLVDFITLLKVRNILKREQIDLVLTHNLLGLSLLIPRLLQKMNIRHIHTVHDLQLMHPGGLVYFGKEKILNSVPAKIYQLICKNIFAKTVNLIAPSNWLMGQYVERGFFPEANKFVLPNPVLQHFDTTKVIKKDGGKFVFLYVGQIEDHKGVLFLAKTFINFWFSFHRGSVYDKSRLNVELLIVGSGSRLGELGKIAYGDERIRIVGGKTSEEVSAIMKEADCLLVPSLCYENSPLVIYEALSSGLPVIAARIGGITELVSDRGGILFNPGEEKDLIKKMEYLLNNRELFASAGGKGQINLSKNYVDNLLSIL